MAIAPEHLFASDMAAGRQVEVWALGDASGEHLFAAWARDTDPGTRRVVEWLVARFAK
ncbi:MAG: hypothetical protein KDK24_08780 [Pseudooceanicola sp.]|nr:hypothetical protein [Pseudooceanicola sp.]